MNKLTNTGEKLFDSIDILEDGYGEKYIFISYEEAYYLDDELLESMMTLVKSGEEVIINGEPVGTLYNVGYNI